MMGQHTWIYELQSQDQLFIIQLFSCPLVWHSKLQSQIVALSTCEAVHFRVSHSLLIEAITIMRGYSQEFIPAPKVHCKAFEGNNGSIELIRAPKMKPHSKSTSIESIIILVGNRSPCKGEIVSIHPIKTNKPAREDIVTKPDDKETLMYLRKQIMNW
jgi:hypothetical protein